MARKGEEKSSKGRDTPVVKKRDDFLVSNNSQPATWYKIYKKAPTVRKRRSAPFFGGVNEKTPLKKEKSFIRGHVCRKQFVSVLSVWLDYELLKMTETLHRGRPKPPFFEDGLNITY